MKYFKRIASLVLAFALVLGFTQVAFAGSSSATESVVAIINPYTAKASLTVSSSSYSAYTSYGTTADTISVSVTIKQKSKSTGKALASRTASSSMKNKDKASVSGSAGSTAVFVSGSSTHKVNTFSSSWSKSLSGVYA